MERRYFDRPPNRKSRFRLQQRQQLRPPGRCGEMSASKDELASSEPLQLVFEKWEQVFCTDLFDVHAGFDVDKGVHQGVRFLRYRQFLQGIEHGGRWRGSRYAILHREKKAAREKKMDGRRRILCLALHFGLEQCSGTSARCSTDHLRIHVSAYRSALPQMRQRGLSGVVASRLLSD